MNVPSLNALKCALIEEDYEQFASLCENIPSEEEALLLAVQNLIKETVPLLKEKQKACHLTMEKINKNREFLAQEKQKNRLCTLS